MLKTAAPLLCIAVLALTGCIAHRTVVSANGTTVTTNGSQVSVQTSAGSLTLNGGVDIASLGAPVYPGAQTSQGGQISSSTAEGSMQIAGFTTSDAFASVYGFYKSHMPAGSEKYRMTTAAGSIATFTIGDDQSPQETIVTVTSKQGAPTAIQITHRVKASTPAASPT